MDSIEVNSKEGKITVIGEADPVWLTTKLRKIGLIAELGIVPNNRKKKTEGHKKEGVKKEEKKQIWRKDRFSKSCDVNSFTCSFIIC